MQRRDGSGHSRTAHARILGAGMSRDGSDLDGHHQIETLFATAKTKSSARFTLIRDDRKTDVTLDFSKCNPRWTYESR
jgi:hypothetical protein